MLLLFFSSDSLETAYSSLNLTEAFKCISCSFPSHTIKFHNKVIQFLKISKMLLSIYQSLSFASVLAPSWALVLLDDVTHLKAWSKKDFLTFFYITLRQSGTIIFTPLKHLSFRLSKRSSKTRNIQCLIILLQGFNGDIISYPSSWVCPSPSQDIKRLFKVKYIHLFRFSFFLVQWASNIVFNYIGSYTLIHSFNVTAIYQKFIIP